MTINTQIDRLRDDLLLLRVPAAKGKVEKSELRKLSSDKEVEIATAKAEMVATLESLKAERKDLYPVSKAVAASNKQKFAEEIEKFNERRNKAVKTLRAQARAGYVGEHGVKYEELSEKNTDNLIDYFNTARDMAIKNKAEVKFHAWRGEGLTFTRFRLAGANKEQQAIADKYASKIEALKTQRKATTDKKEKSRLSEQIEGLTKRMQFEQNRPDGFNEVNVFQPNPVFWLDPIDLKRDANNPTVWDKTVPRGERRRRMRTHVHVSVGDKKFVTLPLILHRPFPVGAVIKEVSINRKKIGAKFRWLVSFTVKFIEERVASSKGTATVDLGWAKDSLLDADGRIRVAGVRVRKADGTETFEEFCLPSSFATYALKLNDIMSIRDSATNECFDMLKELTVVDPLLKEALSSAQKSRAAAKKNATPPTRHLRNALWLLRKSDEGASVSKSALKSLHQARRDKTIVTLQEAVDVLRDAGMSDVQSVLEAWYERFMHLDNWLANGRDNQLAFKKDYYRRFAHKIAHDNNVLLLDPDNFAKMAKKPDAEKDEKQSRGDVRFIAAPAMLRDALVVAFESVLWNTSVFTSRTCSASCGHVNEKLGASRTFECVKCGHTDDRESNATQNLMNEYLNKPGSFSADKKVAERMAAAKMKEAEEIAAVAATA